MIYLHAKPYFFL